MANARCFDITSYINYNAKNIVYLAECSACMLQYVGCNTNALKTRIRRNISDAQKTGFGTSNISNLSHNFLTAHQGDVSHLQVCGIEKSLRRPRGGETSLEKPGRNG